MNVVRRARPVVTVPVRDKPAIDWVRQRQDSALALGLVTNVWIRLRVAGQWSLFRMPHDAREQRTGRASSALARL